MKHYINSNEEIFAFESDGSQDHLITSDMQPITEAEIVERNKPTPEHLASRIPSLRYAEESKGVTINGIRYAGDESNRQALREAIEFVEDAGGTDFKTWKDSDHNYHPNHPLSDVKDAYRAIGHRRSELIALEGEYVQQVLNGTITDLNTLTWETDNEI